VLLPPEPWGASTMSVTENLPRSVERALGTLGKTNDQVRLAASTDITRDGRFGERWIVALDDRIAVFDPTPAQASILVEVPYSEIRQVDAEPLVGGGVLTASSDGQRLVLLHYSNTLTGKFSRVARTLHAMVNNEQMPEEDDEELASSCPCTAWTRAR